MARALQFAPAMNKALLIVAVVGSGCALPRSVECRVHGGPAWYRATTEHLSVMGNQPAAELTAHAEQLERVVQTVDGADVADLDVVIVGRHELALFEFRDTRVRLDRKTLVLELDENGEIPEAARASLKTMLLGAAASLPAREAAPPRLTELSEAAVHTLRHRLWEAAPLGIVRVLRSEQLADEADSITEARDDGSVSAAEVLLEQGLIDEAKFVRRARGDAAALRLAAIRRHSPGAQGLSPLLVAAVNANPDDELLRALELRQLATVAPDEARKRLSELEGLHRGAAIAEASSAAALAGDCRKALGLHARLRYEASWLEGDLDRQCGLPAELVAQAQKTGVRSSFLTGMNRLFRQLNAMDRSEGELKVRLALDVDASGRVSTAVAETIPAAPAIERGLERHFRGQRLGGSGAAGRREYRFALPR
jgi:hypothetical protein